MARYTPEHRAATRARLLESAREQFRLHGFDALSIDKLMAAAGLTRGGFYLHFESKEALVEEVLDLEPGLLTRLRAATSGADAAEALRAYLGPDEDRVQCPLVAHPQDVRRGGSRRTERYGALVEGVIEALRGAREGEGERLSEDDAALATVLSVGAAILSTATPDRERAAHLRAVAARAVSDLLEST